MLCFAFFNILTFSTLRSTSTSQYSRTRGRNAHKKRANIRRKSEYTKYFALIFKQLHIFSSRTKCWHTLK